MATRIKWGFAGAFSIVVGLFWGCGGSLGGETGGESHFLIQCADSCGSGLNCIAGVCTRGCVVDEDSCADLHPDSECTDASIEPGEVAVCDLACTNDAGCRALGANYSCEAGQCRGTTNMDPATGGNGGNGGSTSGGGSGGASTSGGATTSTTGTAGGNGGGEPVFPCPDEVQTDPIDVKASFVQEDVLVMYVAHGGGCEDHEYGLCFESELGTTEAPRYTGDLRLIHDANGDTCDAYLSTTLRFDLRPYGEYVMSEQDVPGGIVSTSFGSYAFGELGCDDRTFAAEQQLDESAEQTLGLGCTTRADCVWASPELSCFAGCGHMISTAGEEAFTTTTDLIQSAVCDGFDAAECPPIPMPVCDQIPPMNCVEGRCVIE